MLWVQGGCVALAVGVAVGVAGIRVYEGIVPIVLDCSMCDRTI